MLFLEVAQHLSETSIRAIALATTDGVRGDQVTRDRRSQFPAYRWAMPPWAGCLTWLVSQIDGKRQLQVTRCAIHREHQLWLSRAANLRFWRPVSR